MKRAAFIGLALAAASLAACAPSPSAPSVTRGGESIEPRASTEPREAFHRSPGGTFEVDPAAVRALLSAGEARVIDIRDPDELNDELGHIEGVEYLSASAIGAAAEAWDPSEPVVLVCRTGRRSARAVTHLEELGFREVASMTGGMLRWKELGLPTSDDLRDVRPIRPPEAPPAEVALEIRAEGDAPPIELDAADVRWVRISSLFSTGSESCVDGRDPHAVVGTPGGDAGEFIVTLAAAESLGAPAPTRRELAALLDEWIDAFGRFYIHSDEHALEELRIAVASDPRFRSRGVAPATAEAMEQLVRHPPAGLEKALLDHLVTPAHVGCGHLRSMMEAPGEFGVRPGLPEEVLRAVFEHLFRVPDDIDWVVLEGEHHERAVVIVDLEGEVRPYTKVPAIPPSIDGTQTFVLHPEVTAFLREQNATFLIEQAPHLAPDVSAEVLLERMRRVADAQQEAVLRRLAAGLPVYVVKVSPRPMH